MAERKRCPVCGSPEVRVESPAEYAYDHAGLSDIVLVGPGIVRITHCGNCENVTTVVRDEQQLLQVLGLMLVQRSPGMTGEELRYLRSLFEMTQAELAAALALPRRETIADWEGKRGGIFTRSREEITPRLFLLHVFKERVIESDHCALLLPQIESFAGFVETFVEYAGTVLRHPTTRPARSGVHVRLKGRKRWSPELVRA